MMKDLRRTGEGKAARSFGRAHLGLETLRLGGDPYRKLGDFRMRAEFLDGVPIALELFLREHGMNLGMARTADAHDLLHHSTIELALVALVVVARARDEVMSGQPLLATANGAGTDHGA